MLIMVLAAAAMPAAVLWQNVTVGMNSADVQKAQPSAVVSSKPETLKSGAACDLVIPAFEVASDDYRVCFFFKDKRLEQVMLSSVKEPTEPQFRSIVTALRSKYGKEINFEKNILGYDVDWFTSDKVNVSLTYFNKYGSLLNINYQVRLAKDAKGL